MIKNNGDNKLFFRIQLLLDFAIVVFGIFLAYVIAVGEKDFIKYSFEEMIFTIAVLFLIISSIYKPYYCGKRTYLKSMYNSILSLMLIHILMIVFVYISKEPKITNNVYFYSFSISVTLFIFEKKIMYEIYKQIHIKKKVIFVGTYSDEEIITVKLIKKLRHIYAECIILNTEEFELKEIIKYLENIETVFICDKIDVNIENMIYNYCYEHNKEVFSVPNIPSILKNSAKFTTLDDIPLYCYNNKIKPEDLFIKRILDIVLSVIGILLSIPLLIIVYIGVKIQDGGPAFHKQTRLTKNDKEFQIIKFRTMILDAEKHTGAILAQKDDKRITKFGKYLRSTKIDELPQLINVLKGDMSIVGPRPERPEIANKYINDFEEFKYRTKYKAGITGLAQVWGKYNTTYKNKLMFDLYYINNYSAFLDFKILLYTFKVIFIKPSEDEIKEMNVAEQIKKGNLNLKPYSDGS